MNTQDNFAEAGEGKRSAVEIVCVSNGYLVTTGYQFQGNGRDLPRGYVFESFDTLAAWLKANLVLPPTVQTGAAGG